MNANHPNKSDLTIATFDQPAPAEALRDLLLRKGFLAYVHDERRLQRFWFLARPLAGVHVRVAEGSLEGARRLLQVDREAREDLRRAIRCPFCLSSRIEYPAMTSKNLLPTVAAQVLVAVGLMKHEYYCEDCHNTWEPTHADSHPIPRPS